MTQPAPAEYSMLQPSRTVRAEHLHCIIGLWSELQKPKGSVIMINILVVSGGLGRAWWGNEGEGGTQKVWTWPRTGQLGRIKLQDWSGTTWWRDLDSSRLYVDLHGINNGFSDMWIWADWASLALCLAGQSIWQCGRLGEAEALALCCSLGRLKPHSLLPPQWPSFRGTSLSERVLGV